MPSPIGHSLLALAICGMKAPPTLRAPWWWMLILIAAVAPDLDFLPGIIIGEPNRFHQGPTHSISGAFCFAAGLWVLIKPVRIREATILFFVYLSHLIADMLAEDLGAPYGILLLWPFSDQYFLSPVSLFSNFSHGGHGDGLTGVLGDILSTHNLWTIALEVIIVGPLLALVALLRRLKNSH